MATVREGEGATNLDSSMKNYKLPYVKQIATENVLYNTRSSNQVLCDNLRRGGWDEVGGRFKRQGTYIYIYIWLDGADVWQKPTQCCKAIILQLKNKVQERGKNRGI